MIHASDIQVRGLVKRHGSVTAVGGIDLDVAAGEFVVLLGPSGCGKTTTLRCLAGLEDATEGEIRIGGDIVSSPGYRLAPEARNIGMVFQSYALWPHMSVAENVGLALKLRHVPARDLARRVAEALALVGLAGFGDRHAGELSGGQQQRVALARAVVFEPRILLFDEPLSNLDAKMRERMRIELRNLQQRLGITSVYVTHDQQEAMVIADRIVLLQAGRIAQSGTPREIYHHPASRFAADFIGSANILPGRMGDAGRVELAGAALLSSDRTQPAGAAIDVLIRPENIGVSANPGGLRGVVTQAVFMGNLGELEIRVGDLLLRAQCSPAGDWQMGQEIWLLIAPEDVIVLKQQ